MTLNDKLLTGLTLVFLIAAVAILSQNAERIAEVVEGEGAHAAGDDAYAVLPGVPTLLPVTRNDTAMSADDRLLLDGAADCGSLQASPRGFVYEGGSECIGTRRFSYCIVDPGRRTCPDEARARVLVKVIEDPLGEWKPQLIDSMTAASPVLVSRNRDALPDLARLVVEEMVPAPLASAVPDSAGPVPPRPHALPSPRADEAPVVPRGTPVAGSHGNPTERPKQRPGLAAADARPAPRPSGRGRQSDASDASPAADAGSVARIAAAMPGSSPLPASARGGQPAPAPEAASTPADPAAPASGDCRPRARITPRDGAVMQLSLAAPCAGGKRVEIVHGGIAFAELLDGTGRLTLDLPLLDPESAVAFRIEGGPTLALPAKGTLPDTVHRFAISWEGKAQVDLHVLIDGADWGEPGHLWRGNAAGEGAAPGEVVMLGDGSIDKPVRSQILTIRADALGPDTTGFGHRVALVLEAKNGPAACGTDLVLTPVRIEKGRPSAQPPLMVAMPPCDDIAGGVLLKGVIAPFIIRSGGQAHLAAAR